MLETVLRCDTERTELLEEEAKLLRQLNSEGAERPAGGAEAEVSARLEKVSRSPVAHQLATSNSAGKGGSVKA